MRFLESCHALKKHVGRQTCGENMVFCRGLTGQVATLEDFCPIAARRLL